MSVSKFQSAWVKPQTPSMGERIGETFKPKGPLKPRVQTAIAKLQKQISKLDGILTKLNAKDEKLFERIVEATQRHDTHTSRGLSAELAEVRKVRRVLGNAKTALEQIELRLSTCSDLGDVVVALQPTVGLMKGMKSSLAKFMPGADQEISKISEMLGGMMTETFGSGTDSSFITGDPAMTAESQKILEEAAVVAGTSADSKFPPTPSSVDLGSTESSTSKFI